MGLTMSSRVIRSAAAAAAISLFSSFSAPAQAADIYGAPPVIHPTANYCNPTCDTVVVDDGSSGFYIGAFLGYGLSTLETGVPGGNFEYDVDGGVLGIWLGWNFIHDDWLFGVEGDLMVADMDGSRVFGLNTFEGSLDWMGSLRGRLGFFVLNDVLLFAMLGAASAEFDLPVQGPGGGGGSETFTGIQFGFGTEFSVHDDWNIRVDYTFTDFGSETIDYSGGLSGSYDPDVHLFKVGFTYNF